MRFDGVLFVGTAGKEQVNGLGEGADRRRTKEIVFTLILLGKDTLE